MFLADPVLIDKACQSLQNVHAVLQAPKVIGSSGKIVKSGPNDRVFVYFADHGAPGTVLLHLVS